MLVRPHEVLWVDVLLPEAIPSGTMTSPAPTHWLGETWRDASGWGSVHTGEMIRTLWSSAICFAGVGPGEVLVDGAKVVGISQRRTRAGARFQCAVMRTWDPERARCASSPRVSGAKWQISSIRSPSASPTSPRRGRLPHCPEQPLTFARSS